MAVAAVYVTQAADLAVQGAGLPGLTNLKADLIVSPAPPPPDRHAVIGDFTVPTYTGYAQQTVTLTGGFVTIAGLAYALSNALRFTGPSSGSGVNVVGFVLSDGTTHTVWAWGLFDVPLPEQVSTDVVEIVLNLPQVQTALGDQVAP